MPVLCLASLAVGASLAVAPLPSADSADTVGTAGVPAVQGERYELAGDSVAVYDLVGTVSLVPGSGRAVAVTVRRTGADAARLRMEAGAVRGVPALRVIYPSDDIRAPRLGRHSETTLDVRADGTFDDDRHYGDRGRRVRISGDRGLEAGADLEIAVPAGRAVAVHLAVGELTARNVDGRLTLTTASANVSASGMKGALMVDVGSGDVRVTGGEGDLSVDTGSGNVTVSDVRGRDLHIDTGSGNVEVTGSGATTASIDTGSGDLTLTGFSGDHLELDTGSGNARVDLARRVRELSIDTGSGDVTVRAPQDFGASVHLEASSGEIETDFEVASAHRDDGELSGTIGDGSGRLQVETGSGNIRLLRR